MSNPYSDNAALLEHFESRIPKTGGEKLVKTPPLAHVPIRDTETAACIATLGILYRTPGPYTDHVELDANGNEVSRVKYWWLAASSGNDDQAHKTEEILAAWDHRERFESDFPDHPLVHMRRALDAREYWLDVIHGRRALAREGSGNAYATGSLREASVLKAAGFVPIALVNRHFLFQPTHLFRPAHDVLLNSHSLEMNAPEQWCRRVLHILDEMLKIVRASSVIIAEPHDDQILLLTADSTKKTRDKFHRQLV